MWTSIMNSARSFARPRVGQLAIIGVALIATLGWNGCSEDSAPLSAPDGAQPTVQTQINGYDTLPPEAREKVDLVVGVIDDITSEQPDRVAAGMERLDLIQPGLYDELMTGLNFAFNGDGGTFTFSLPIEIESRATLEDPKICTKITVDFTITILKGSKFCYENGDLEHCTELDADTVFHFTKVFEFECSGIEGCEIEHSSTTTTRYNKHIQYKGPDKNGNGTPDVDVDITVKAQLKIKVEVTTCK